MRRSRERTPSSACATTPTRWPPASPRFWRMGRQWWWSVRRRDLPLEPPLGQGALLGGELIGGGPQVRRQLPGRVRGVADAAQLVERDAVVVEKDRCHGPARMRRGNARGRRQPSDSIGNLARGGDGE